MQQGDGRAVLRSHGARGAIAEAIASQVHPTLIRGAPRPLLGPEHREHDVNRALAGGRKLICGRGMHSKLVNLMVDILHGH